MTDLGAGDEPRPAGSIRVASVTAHAFFDRSYPPREPSGLDEDEAVSQVQLTANLDLVCPQEEWTWWEQQLKLGGVALSGHLGSPAGVKAVFLRVAPDDVEGAVQRLLTVLDQAASTYEEEFEPWHRRRLEGRAAVKRKQQERSAPYQAVADRVLRRHDSDEPPGR